MPLVPLRPVLDATVKFGYAQGAFNVNAVAQAEAVIAVHEMFRSPAILQGADLANAFMGGRVDFANGTLEDKKKGARNIAEAVKKFAEQSPIPVVLHLDHGKNFDSCVAAIEGGYTSVMIDGSSLPFEENVELTREVVKYAHARGVLLYTAEKCGIPLHEYTPSQVKMAVVGYGKAEKRQVMDMTRRLLHLKAVPRPDDAADALALALCHARSATSRLPLQDSRVKETI